MVWGKNVAQIMAVNRLKMAGCSEVLCDAQSDHFKHHYYYCGTIWQRQIDRSSERVDKTGRDWPRCVCVCVFGAISLTCRLSIGVIGICLPVCNCASFKVSLLFLVLPLFMSPLIFRCLRRQTEGEKVRACQSIDRERERDWLNGQSLLTI